MTTGDKGKLLNSFCSFIYSLPTQQDCVLPVVECFQLTQKSPLALHLLNGSLQITKLLKIKVLRTVKAVFDMD